METALRNISSKKRRSDARKGFFSQFILHLVIIIALILVFFPLVETFIGSVKSVRDYQENMWTISFPLRFFNYATVWPKVSRYFWNTVLVTLAGVSGMILISSLASYAIGKIKFRGSSLLFWLVLVLMMLPGIMTFVPSTLLYRSLRLNDTMWALIVPSWTGGCISATFLLTSAYRSLPKEIFEAAEVDGANEFKQFFAIGVPLTAPIIGTCSIMQILYLWGDYVWCMTIQSDPSLYTMPAGILYRFSNYTNTPEQYAAYIIASLPLIAVFIFLNRYYIKGLLDSAIKM